MSPEYFHTKLTFSEAGDYIEGLGRRYRPAWEQARLVADVTARCAGNKKGIGLEFDWEKAARLAAQKPPTEKDLQELKAFADKINKVRHGI